MRWYDEFCKYVRSFNKPTNKLKFEEKKKERKNFYEGEYQVIWRGDSNSFSICSAEDGGEKRNGSDAAASHFRYSSSEAKRVGFKEIGIDVCETPATHALLKYAIFFSSEFIFVDSIGGMEEKTLANLIFT